MRFIFFISRHAKLDRSWWVYTDNQKKYNLYQ